MPYLCSTDGYLGLSGRDLVGCERSTIKTQLEPSNKANLLPIVSQETLHIDLVKEIQLDLGLFCESIGFDARIFLNSIRKRQSIKC